MVKISKETTRRQHYVWQYYLRKWSLKNKVFVKKENNIFESSTKNIMVERDFYKVHRLNDIEKQIRDKIGEDSRPNVNEHIIKEFKLLDLLNHTDEESFDAEEIVRTLISDFGMSAKYKNENIDFDKIFKSISVEGKNFINNQLKEEYKNKRIQHGEDMISLDEDNGKKFLDMIYIDDLSFLTKGEQERFDFYYFMMFIYMRTNKIKNIFVPQLEKIVDLIKKDYPNIECDAIKIYSHFLHALIIKSAFGIYYDKEYKVMIMNTKGKRFITGDQPAFNLNDSLDQYGYNDKMRIYMPINTYKAIILDNKIDSNKIVDVDDKTVNYLNNFINKNSYKFIVGMKEEDLI